MLLMHNGTPLYREQVENKIQFCIFKPPVPPSKLQSSSWLLHFLPVSLRLPIALLLCTTKHCQTTSISEN
jgi:hypothetical protein